MPQTTLDTVDAAELDDARWWPRHELEAAMADRAVMLPPPFSIARQLIDTWLDYKRSNEVDAFRLRPHPHEFELYYDV